MKSLYQFETLLFVLMIAMTLTRSASAQSTVTGKEKVLVMLVTFQNTPTDFYKFPKSTATNKVFGATAGGLNNFLIENSFGRYSITGDVANWEVLPMNRPTMNNEFMTITNAAIAKAEIQLGVNRSDYKRFILLGDLPFTYAYVGYGHVRTLNNTTSPIPIDSLNHEFGHTIGLSHARRADCGAGVSISRENCVPREYEDYFDTMGGRGGHYQTDSKIELGWILPSEILDVTTSGTYTLYPYESKTAPYKAIRFLRGSGNGMQPMYMEYRQPIGFDSNLHTIRNNNSIYQPSEAYTGPLFRIAHDLIDATPNDGDWIKSSLYNGSTLVDPATGTRISVQSNNMDTVNPENSRMLINVNVGKTKLTGPTITILEPSINATINSNLKISFRIEDSTGISNIFARFNNQDITSLLTVQSDGRYEATIPMDSYQPGLYYFDVNATDRACFGITGCQYNNETWASQLVNFIGFPGRDYTAPTVAILSPAMNSTIQGVTNFTLNATDNVAIIKAELRIFGEVRSTSMVAPFTLPLDTYRLVDGFYPVQVTVYDAAGNSSNAFTNIMVSNPGADLILPTAKITSPSNATGATGVKLVKVTATDNLGVTRVELYINNSIVNMDNVEPFEFSVDTRMYAAGIYSLKAISFDAKGNSKASAVVKVAFSNPADTIAPTLVITSPSQGASLGDSATITASASDLLGISKVEFYIDGVRKKSDTTSASYDYVWSSISIGPHVIEVRAYDYFGNVTSRSITVQRP